MLLDFTDHNDIKVDQASAGNANFERLIGTRPVMHLVVALTARCLAVVLI